ncbi:hypothetical protein TNCV_832951 [Trichonephila clavipes]|uniref:Uncharacterized protein n=1 Tax=Trichonephila clavipes TaxID=2585209 RepID=A0A8X6RDZ9_TRICX|nr:hypothetical protein TNCV_832951 [Trichonephila clavipes]
MLPTITPLNFLVEFDSTIVLRDQGRKIKESTSNQLGPDTVQIRDCSDKRKPKAILAIYETGHYTNIENHHMWETGLKKRFSFSSSHLLSQVLTQNLKWCLGIFLCQELLTFQHYKTVLERRSTSSLHPVQGLAFELLKRVPGCAEVDENGVEQWFQNDTEQDIMSDAEIVAAVAVYEK